MKKMIAIALCSFPLALAGTAFAAGYGADPAKASQGNPPRANTGDNPAPTANPGAANTPTLEDAEKNRSGNERDTEKPNTGDNPAPTQNNPGATAPDAQVPPGAAVTPSDNPTPPPSGNTGDNPGKTGSNNTMNTK